MGGGAVNLSSLVAAFRPGALVSVQVPRMLADVPRFSEIVLRMPLRRYQREPLRAIMQSILKRQGLEFLLVFPRQSGKNEAVAHLLVYLLNLYRRWGGNIIYGATGTGLGLGIERLEARLDNAWNLGQWTRKARPDRRGLDDAQVVFLSTNPTATARGQTAHHLLIIDEAQDASSSHIEAVFSPMRAAYNATAVYIGTVKLTTDFLWQKKQQLERAQAEDGIQRVFLVKPDEVIRENSYYHDFLKAQVAAHGRQHPIIASEYYLEPIDGSGGLFPPRRRALMRGAHARQRHPQPGALYVATIDVAGEDEAATDPLARLAHPGRDYTVATIFQVIQPAPGAAAPGPTYHAVDVFVDHGSKHFEEVPGKPALVQRLVAFLEHWHVAHLVVDESGVGLGLTSWLKAAFGEQRVTGLNFGGAGAKAALGAAFLALVETGRFHYWTQDDDHDTDAFWFWKQVKACTYEVPPDGRFDRDLRWSVPASHRTDTPTGSRLTHDDRLLSAALVAHLDRKLADGSLLLGSGASAVVPAADPLSELSFQRGEAW